MSNYNGQLNQNEIFGSLYNMLISQYVFTDQIASTYSKIVDESRTDGSMYGDTKVYYDSDINESTEWLGDDEAQNLLKLHRPEDPDTQAITIDKARMVAVTLDEFLTKRAFMDEYSFQLMNSRIQAWMRDTKKIYDSTYFKSYVGTTESSVGKQQQVIKIPTGTAPESAVERQALYLLRGELIAQGLADLIINLEDNSRDFNDNQNMKAIDVNSLKFVFNSKWINEIRKVSLPTMFHNEGLVDKFAQYILPERFFGKVDKVGGTADGTQRSLIEMNYNSVEMGQPGYDKKKHIFPGDIIPIGEKFEANKAYTVDNSIICKIYHKDSIPFMTGFETTTEFWNPRSLTRNHYLIWMYNGLQYLYNYPMITVKAEDEGIVQAKATTANAPAKSPEKSA